MSFFESIPQPSPPEPTPRPREAWERSDSAIPASVPADVMLFRTEQVAAAIGNIRAHPNGFEFRLSVRVRNEDETDLGWFDPTELHRHRRGTQVPGNVLRLGVLYADGRRVATTSHPPWPDDDADAEYLILLPEGSGGGDRAWDGDFWVHPLPPDGPVTFVASWLEQGVPETRAELDAAAIREAAGRAVVLWPEDPDWERGTGWSSRTFTGRVSDDPSTGSEPG